MSLRKYYKYAVLIPSMVTIISYVLYTIIDLRFGPKYTSEWVTANSMAAWAIILLVINCVCICLLALTLFLNNNIRIRKSFLLSAASWFLLPMTWVGIVLLNNDNDLLNEGGIFILFNTVPFIIGLVLTFVRFRSLHHKEQ